MYKVLEGGRPDRPPSGFSDQLWELLVSAWCVEHGSQPSQRPSASIILDQLNEDVDDWGESILPPPSVQRHERCRSFAHVGVRSSAHNSTQRKALVE